jgi:hypothetical protein
MAMAGTAVGAAVIAGSAALLGSGLDSGIEAPACIIVIWRFTWTRLDTRPRTGPATSGRAGKPPSPRAPSRTTILRPRAQLSGDRHLGPVMRL